MKNLKRNPQAVLAQLVEDDSGQIFTKSDCIIQIPVRFSEKGLGQVGVRNFTYGLFPIILPSGDYSVCNVAALIEIDPYKTLPIKIKDVEYHEFHFKADSVLIKTSDVVKRDTLMFAIMDELIFKGKIPWYVGYEDLGKIFDTAKDYGNSHVGQTYEVVEFIAAMVSRPKDERDKYLRAVINNYSDTSLDKIDYVPLQSIFYSVHSTLNKLAGSYFNDGITSALTTPTEEISKIESILRS